MLHCQLLRELAGAEASSASGAADNVVVAQSGTGLEYLGMILEDLIQSILALLLDPYAETWITTAPLSGWAILVRRSLQVPFSNITTT